MTSSLNRKRENQIGLHQDRGIAFDVFRHCSQAVRTITRALAEACGAIETEPNDVSPVRINRVIGSRTKKFADRCNSVIHLGELALYSSFMRNLLTQGDTPPWVQQG